MILAVLVYLGPLLPDGRREVTIELDAPWSWFDDSGELIDDEPEDPPAPYVGVFGIGGR